MVLPTTHWALGGARVLPRPPGSRSSWSLCSQRGPRPWLGHAFLPGGRRPVPGLLADGRGPASRLLLGGRGPISGLCGPSSGLLPGGRSPVFSLLTGRHGPVSSLRGLCSLRSLGDGGGRWGVQPPHPEACRPCGEGPFKGVRQAPAGLCPTPQGVVQGGRAPLGLGQGDQRAPQLLPAWAGRPQHTFRKPPLGQAASRAVLTPWGRAIPRCKRPRQVRQFTCFCQGLGCCGWGPLGAGVPRELPHHGAAGSGGLRGGHGWDPWARRQVVGAFLGEARSWGAQSLRGQGGRPRSSRALGLWTVGVRGRAPLEGVKVRRLGARAQGFSGETQARGASILQGEAWTRGHPGLENLQEKVRSRHCSASSGRPLPTPERPQVSASCLTLSLHGGNRGAGTAPGQPIEAPE